MFSLCSSLSSSSLSSSLLSCILHPAHYTSRSRQEGRQLSALPLSSTVVSCVLVLLNLLFLWVLLLCPLHCPQPPLALSFCHHWSSLLKVHLILTTTTPLSSLLLSSSSSLLSSSHLPSLFLAPSLPILPHNLLVSPQHSFLYSPVICHAAPFFHVLYTIVVLLLAGTTSSLLLPRYLLL